MLNSDKVSQEVLEYFGFRVEKLKESNDRKEADFLGEFGGKIFLIEAKLKTDAEAKKTNKERTLASGGIHVHEDSLGRDETLSGVIREAARQIKSSAAEYRHGYKLLFLLSYGISPRVKSDKAIDTLYGRTKVTEFGSNKMKPCYFYRNSDFYRRKDSIDGAIEGYIDYDGMVSLKLCLNTYSSNYESLKSSFLASLFGDAVIDPIREEKEGRAYIPDEDIEKIKDESKILTPLINPVLLHLKEKYGTGFLLNVDFNAPEYSIRTRAKC